MPTTTSLFLLRELVKRDFQSRYSGSLLGFVWSFVQPLWQLVLLTFVFAVVLKISLVGERTDSFWAFLFCGLLPWLAVHEGIVRATTSVADGAALVKRLTFPAEYLVLAVVVTAVVHQLIGSVIFMLVLAGVGQLSLQSLPWLVLALPLQVGLTLGLALLLAAVYPFVRDVLQLVTMVLAAWFYLTPIVYPLAQVPASMRSWIALNPMTPLVGLYRAAFLGGAPGSFASLASMVALVAVLLAAGTWAFARLKPAFADVL